MKSVSLSQQMLLGDLKSKERIRSFYWAAHQLARKMNFMQMAELTQSCPDLQAVFDLAALIRMRNGPLAEATGKSSRPSGKALSLRGRSPALVDLQELEHNKTIAEKKFEEDLRIIYAATLLFGRSSSVLKFVESYPVYDKDGDKIAAEAALEDIKLAMSYGSESLRHLLARNQPIHRKGGLSFLSSIFPAFGGKVITHLSHSHHTLALFLKLTLLGAFFCLLLFFLMFCPNPNSSGLNVILRCVGSGVFRLLRFGPC